MITMMEIVVSRQVGRSQRFVDRTRDADPQTPHRGHAGGTPQREASDAEGDLEVADDGANAEPKFPGELDLIWNKRAGFPVSCCYPAEQHITNLKV